MKIEKLKKTEIAEGITLDMVSRVNPNVNYSPIMLQSGDEPCDILKCSTGYWVMIKGETLKDEKGKRIVFPERDCIIGRVRYLLIHGHEEKKAKVAALVAKWKGKVDKKISEIETDVTVTKRMLDRTDSLNGALLEGALTQEKIDSRVEQEKRKLSRMQSFLERFKEMQSNGDYVPFVNELGIADLNMHMFSAKLDNENDVRILKNTFGADALAEWDGDMLMKYAAIEIEKESAV